MNKYKIKVSISTNGSSGKIHNKQMTLVSDNESKAHKDAADKIHKRYFPIDGEYSDN